MCRYKNIWQDRALVILSYIVLRYHIEQENIKMESYKLVLLKGDGIGPEIVCEAVKVLNKAADKFGFSIEHDEALIGGCAIDATGTPLPEITIEKCKAADSVILGAVGGPKWDTLPGNLRPEAGLLGIRSALGLFANLRPAVIFDALRDASPLKDEVIGRTMNIMVVRELTGGIYFGKKGRKEINGTLAAYDTETYTIPEIKRIAKVAFEMAMNRNKKLTNVDKANVLESSRLWRETIIEVSKEYPEIELNHLYVDNCAMQLVRNPAQFDVIVTSNIFGDILSDEASMISGSIGMLASASLNEKKAGLYEPIHGSAPDIAGKGIANPLATILSVAMMLKHSLDQPNAARAIESAVSKALKVYRTPDIYTDGTKKVNCKEMGDIICSLL